MQPASALYLRKTLRLIRLGLLLGLTLLAFHPAALSQTIPAAQLLSASPLPSAAELAAPSSQLSGVVPSAYSLDWLCSDECTTDNPNCLGTPEWSPSPDDEIWLVNTRQLADCLQDCSLATELPVSRWHDGQFQADSLANLLESSNSNPDIRNVVYIHGNFTDYGWSVRRGLEVYHHCFEGCSNRRPVRFIIWSWRSERETLLGRDYQIKSQRAVAEGCRLNSLVCRLGSSPPIVIGYSLGAQATLSALSQPDSEQGQPWVVALIAAALDPYFCGTMRQNPQISARLEHLLLFTNHVDPALNCSRRITRRTTNNPSPPGQYSIIPSLRSSEATLEQFEVSREVGYHHSISRYLGSPTVSTHLQRLLAK
jgi:hypothetical protein